MDNQLRQEIKDYLKNNLRIEVKDVYEKTFNALFGMRSVLNRRVILILDGEEISSDVIRTFDADQG
jgi:hypothetical protein